MTAGLDLIFAFIDEVYGSRAAEDIQGTIEYKRTGDACDDPFAEIHGVEPTWECNSNGRM